jgi:DNA-binding NarL/FixJ family response regulator
MGEGAPIKILLAGQHALLLQAIHSALDNEPDIDVVAETRSGPETVAEAEDVTPDVGVLEVDTSRGEGLQIVATLRKQVPSCRIILLADGEDLNILIDGLEAGAHGYVSKESPLADLLEAARAVIRGELLIPSLMLSRVITRLIQRRKERDEGVTRVSGLTPREREVLRLLATGADNAAIGRALVISPQTARTHIQNILSKLGAHSRLEAVALARGSGIFEDDVARTFVDDEREMIALG